MGYRKDIIMDILFIFLGVTVILGQENIIIKRCKLKYIGTTTYIQVLREKITQIWQNVDNY